MFKEMFFDKINLRYNFMQLFLYYSMVNEMNLYCLGLNKFLLLFVKEIKICFRIWVYVVLKLINK